MSYNSAIEYLYGLQKQGMKFGLQNIRRLLSALGNPQQAFRSVHVAGTNGKGSTAMFLESILRTGAVKTGLFTSPHLVSFTERIRVNGREISEHDVIILAGEVRRVSESLEDFSPTFFEVVTAMAFLYFRSKNIDWAVVEVGMGGRLDATNTILPEAAVITGISDDHREFLGRTLSEIAGEKAGILKENVPVITAEQVPEVLDVIERRAVETRSEIFRYNQEFSAEIISKDPEAVCFHYRGTKTYRGIRLHIAGEHQVLNASLAAKAAEVVTNKFPQLSCDIRKGIEDVRYEGRLEMIMTGPPILIDGAHNPAAAKALSEHLRKLLDSKYRRIILVAGIMHDKHIRGILEPLLPVASEILFTAPAYGRAAKPELLSAHAEELGYSSRRAITVAEALTLAETLYEPGDLIVVTGSFYTTGEAKETLFHKGVLTRLRE